MSRQLSRIAIALALLLATLSWAAGPVHQARAATIFGECEDIPGQICAPVTVTDCTESGTQAAFQLAWTLATVADLYRMPDATTIIFACSGTISLSSPITLIHDVTISGNGQKVMLSGGGTGPVFVVNAGTHATLKGMTITRGSPEGIANSGNLTVANSTLSGNAGPGITSSGILTVINSTFSGNSGGLGAGISNHGALDVINSTFSGNGSTDAGSGISNQGTATVANSILSDNGGNCVGAITDNGGNLADDGSCSFTQSSSTNNATGLNLAPLADNGGPTPTIALLPGSIAIDATSCLLDSDQRGFVRPDSAETTCDSGAFESGSTAATSVSICSETGLTDAITAATVGGSFGTVRFTRDCTMFLSSTITLGQDVTIDGNGHKVTLNGGGNLQVFSVNSGVTAALDDLTITSGSAGGAGGIGNAGTLAINSSTVTGNSCLGGGDCAGGIYNHGTLTVINSTVTGNSGGVSAAGGITNVGTLALTNSTVSNNSGAAGGILIEGPSAVTTFTNTILSSNGSDCSFFLSGHPITDNGGNLADDGSCGFTLSSSTNNATSLHLGPLADNGGPSQTITLLPGSAAIDFAAANCPRTDQRGIVRPDNASDNGACDSGAVEAKELYLRNVPGNIVVAATSPAGAVVNFTPPTVVDAEGQPVGSARVVCSTPSGPVVSGTTFPITSDDSYFGLPALPTITCTAFDSAFTNRPSTSFTVTVLLVPSITGITPGTSTPASPASTLTLTGTGFVTGSAAYLYSVSTGQAVKLTTTVNSFTQLTAGLPANLAVGAALITVKNLSGRESSHWPWFVTTSAATLAGTPSSSTVRATTGGSGRFTAGSVTVIGGDIGFEDTAVGVALYASNPGGPLFGSSSAYFDAFVVPPSLDSIDPTIGTDCFTSGGGLLCSPRPFLASSGLTIVDCNLNGGSQVQWWNGTAWLPASNQSYNTPTGCVTITVNNTTTPNLTQMSGTPFGVVTPAPMVTVPSAQSVQYGADLNFTVTATNAVAGRHLTLTASGLPTGVTFKDNGDGTGTVSGTVTASVGASPYTASFTANDGISDSPAGAVAITVTPAPLTITADNQLMTYGGTQPALTWTANFVNGDTTDSLTTAPGCSTVPATSPAGGYDITCSGAVDPNYTIGYAKGTLTVAARVIMVTASSPSSQTYGSTSAPTVTCNAAGFLGTDTFATAPAAAVYDAASTTKVTITSSSDAGSYVTKCTGGDPGGNYSIGTYTSGSFTINPAPLTITANDQTYTYGDPFSLGTSVTKSDSSASLSGTLSCAAYATTDATYTTPLAVGGTTRNAGSYAIQCSGLDNTNYRITWTPSTLTVKLKVVHVAASAGSITYGTAAPTSFTTTYTTGDFAGGDTSGVVSGSLICSTTYIKGNTIGSYPITCTSALSATNYTFVSGYDGTGSTLDSALPSSTPALRLGTLTVSPAPLSFTVNASMTYGGAVPTLIALAPTDGKMAFSGFVNGEGTSVVSGQTASCATTASSTTNVGSYPITGCTGFTAGNYTITFDSGHSNVTVNKATTSVSLASSLNPAMSTQSVTFTATMSVTPPGGGTPTGKVTFSDGSLSLGTGTLAVVNGKDQATMTTSSLSLGAHSITASYAGDTNFKPSDTTANPLTQYIDTNLTGFPKLSSGAYNLQNALLSGAYLAYANLAGTNASNATLTNATLTSANLSGANLSQANLSGAIMSKANLTNANLSQANLKGATGLSTATLTGVIWSKTTCPDGTLNNNDGGTCGGHL